MTQLSKTLELDRKHVFRSWSAQADIKPVVIKKALGSWMWDENDNKYLDFCSQRVNVNIGHSHPRMVNGLKKQLEKLSTLSQIHATKSRSEAARMIAERTPGDLNRIFFTNAGADAIEHSVRLARLHTGRQKILTAHRSYHGSTAGALTLTGDTRRWGGEPGVPGVIRFFGPYLYRSPFWADTESQEAKRAIKHLEEVIKFEGPHNIAAILVETVVGSNGLLPPPGDYLLELRKLCTFYNIVMICDEIMVGFGRCGEWFAVNRWDVVPDMITFAKGVNSGYVPLGGVAMSEDIASSFEENVFPGGGTYYGHPLACEAARLSIEIFEEEKLIQNARRLETELFLPALNNLYKKHSIIGEIRGLGCFWVLELVKDRASREPLMKSSVKGASDVITDKIQSYCREKGLWILITGNRLFICPPLNTPDSDIEWGLEIIDDVLGQVSHSLVQ